jgi:hypothetical protein
MLRGLSYDTESSQLASQISSHSAAPIGHMLMNISEAAAPLAFQVFKEHHGIAHAIRA